MIKQTLGLTFASLCILSTLNGDESLAAESADNRIVELIEDRKLSDLTRAQISQLPTIEALTDSSEGEIYSFDAELESRRYAISPESGLSLSEVKTAARVAIQALIKESSKTERHTDFLRASKNRTLVVYATGNREVWVYLYPPEGILSGTFKVRLKNDFSVQSIIWR
jgi:hypothetical protein